jgi:hypothetical protein
MLSGYVLLTFYSDYVRIIVIFSTRWGWNQRRNKLSPTSVSVESVLKGDVHSLKNHSQRFSTTLFHTFCKEAVQYWRKHKLVMYYADRGSGYRALTLSDAIQCVLMRRRGVDPEENYFWFDAEPMRYWPEMEEHILSIDVLLGQTEYGAEMPQRIERAERLFPKTSTARPRRQLTAA